MESKLPPQATDVEEYILSSILADGRCMDICSDILKPEMFYSSVHSMIYGACYSMYAKNIPIDLMTVVNQLRTNGELENVGGTFAVMQIGQKPSYVHHVQQHCLIVKEKYLLRKLAQITGSINAKCYDSTSDVFELIGEAENAIFEATKDTSIRAEITIGDAYLNQIKQIEAQKTGEMVGYPTYIQAVDNILQGIKPQNLVIIAGRPSMGKTSLALTFASNMCTIGKIPVGFFSMEMSTEELTAKITSINAKIPLNFMVARSVTGEYFNRMMNYVPTMNETPLYINDAPALTVMQLRSNARKMVIKYGVKVIFVDYLGLMKPESGNGRTRENEVSEISSGLKAIAKELNIPVIALSQLSRASEQDSSRRPELRHLRDSGSIEQDADIVMFPFRPSYYSMEGNDEILVKKHRNGKLGDAPVKFVGEYTKFQDLGTDIEYAIYGTDVTNKDLGEPF